MSFKSVLKASELPKKEYHEYYRPYVLTLGDAGLMDSLEKGLVSMQDFLKSCPPDKIDYAYAFGKWTIAEVIMHLIDTERIFQYRSLRFYRGDQTELSGFDQDDYIKESGAGNKNKIQLLNEYSTVRTSSIALFKSFKEEHLNRAGIASKSLISVRALGFLISGHQKHHLAIVQERYFD